MKSEFPTFGFQLEFFDERAELVRPYIMQYFTQNSEIELFDVRQKKVFLKKTNLHNITTKDLFIGNKLLINGRQYEIIDFSDEFTRKAFSSSVQKTYAMIKPGFSQRLGEAIDRIYQSGLTVSKLRFGLLSKQVVSQFYEEHVGKPFYDDLVNYITSGPIIAMELVGLNAISKWRQLIGPTNLETAKRDAPNSLRALYATSTSRNFAHGSDSVQSADRELGLIFGNRSVQLINQLEETTLCVIKPHAVKDGFSGKIIQQITQSGYQITGAVMTTLDFSCSSEFLEVYRGVVPEYHDMVTQFASGPLLALELSKENALTDFRELCGPRDPNVAKRIRPNSLRSLFGTDVILNAVHCTDLQEDAELETEYFFVLLDE